MRIGILGSGLMGGKLGTLFARAGHEVVFSYARSQAKLKRLARIAGDNALAGTPAEAAQGADALLLAVHWSRFPDVLQQAGDISGKIIVSCSLPMNAGDSELVVAQTRRAWRSLQRSSRRRESSPHSTACPARSFSASTKGGAEPKGRAWCIVATTSAPRRSPPP